jgi:putative holliday junction resolvase
VTGLLGIDLGERRIGVAIADGADVGARPLVTLRRARSIDADVTALEELIARHAIDELVVGLPIDAAGHESAQAASTREWVDAVGARLGGRVVIALRDERLTSHLAETRLGPMPRGRSGGPPTRQQRDAYRARVDREAAAIILQDELDSRRSSRSAPSPATMETRR